MENTLKVYKSDKFDVEDTTSLSLFLYPHSLAIFAKDKNLANIGIHYYTSFDWDDLDKIVVSDPLLKLDLPAKLYIHQPVFSVVPGVLFQPGQEESYLSFAGKMEKDPFYYSSPMDSNNIQLVSFLSKKAKKALEARFSELSYHHGASSFLSYLFKERFNLIGQEISVCIIDNYIYLAAFTDQEISVFNIFEIKSREDILKYISILITQLGYEKNHVRITVYGATEHYEVTENWAKDYFLHFRILRPHSNQNYSHGFKHLKSGGLFEAFWQFE